MELHDYFINVRQNIVLEFHIMSTTIGQAGKRTMVVHVVEIQKTDKNGKVTTEVYEYLDDLASNAA
jgi:hypothetical protein